MKKKNKLTPAQQASKNPKLDLVNEAMNLLDFYGGEVPISCHLYFNGKKFTKEQKHEIESLAEQLITDHNV